MLRIRCPVERSDQYRDAFRFQGLESRDHAQEDLTDLPHRRLFIVQRVQQTEDHGRAGTDRAEKRRQKARHGLLQLVTGETAGEKKIVQQAVGIAARQTGGMDQGVGVEPVASVHHRDAHAAQQRGRGDPMGDGKHILATVQGVQTAGRKGKLFCQERRGYRIGGGGHGKSSRVMPDGPEDVLRHFCRIVKSPATFLSLIRMAVSQPRSAPVRRFPRRSSSAGR